MDNLRLNIERSPFPPLVEPEVGLVYRMQGGPMRGERFMVIVAIRQNTAYLLTFFADGSLHGNTQYGLHYLAEKQVVGRLTSMPLLDVEWFQ